MVSLPRKNTLATFSLVLLATNLSPGGHINMLQGHTQGCQMAKFDPFLSLDCARVEGVGAQSKEGRKGSNFAA